MLGQVGPGERHVGVGMDHRAKRAVDQEGAALGGAQLLEPFLEGAQRQLDRQHPAGPAGSLDRQGQHQARDRSAAAPGQHVGRPERQPLRLERLAQRHRGGVGLERVLVDLLVVGPRLRHHLAEAHGRDHRVALVVEETDHVGALRLLVDEQQGLLARLLI